MTKPSILVLGIDPPPTRRRRSLSRPELAVCLVAEVVYEHDEPVRGHAAALAHAALLAAFGAEPLVARHALQLAVHLLHSLSARHCHLHRASGAHRSERGNSVRMAHPRLICRPCCCPGGVKAVWCSF